MNRIKYFNKCGRARCACVCCQTTVHSALGPYSPVKYMSLIIRMFPSVRSRLVVQLVFFSEFFSSLLHSQVSRPTSCLSSTLATQALMLRWKQTLPALTIKRALFMSTTITFTIDQDLAFFQLAFIACFILTLIITF